MGHILGYLSMNYLTLIMLAGFVMILYANRKSEIKGVGLIGVIMGLVVALTGLEYMEQVTEAKGLDIRLEYIKTSAVYCIYPLISLLEIYLMVPMRRKLLLSIPYLVFVGAEIADLFGTKMTYSFNAQREFQRGALGALPIIISSAYVILLMLQTVIYFRSGDISKALIIVFSALSILLTSLLELFDIVTDILEEMIVFEIILYYLYLAAIQSSEIQKQLHRKELDLEKSKLTMLMTQIKPHFINNCLMAIEEYCYEEPERAAEMIHHFSLYLRNNLAAAEGAPVSFMKEIDAVKEYLALEYAGKTKRFRVDFELGLTDFTLPALSVEPLVENAVKHGIDRYSPESRVKISSYRNGEDACIEIRDNGRGFDLNSETLGESGIGLRNTELRLAMMCGGRVGIERKDGWTVIRITIPMDRRSENGNDNS